MRCFAFIIPAVFLLAADAFEPSATLLLLGDIMLGRGVAGAHAAGGWEAVLQPLAPLIRAADLSAANLESPIACTESRPDSRSLAAPPEAALALAASGLKAVSTVNNHAVDAGEAGSCTGTALSRLGIAVLDSPSRPLEFAVRGLPVELLGFDFTREPAPDALRELEQKIRRADEAGSIVVVSLHWGLEYQAGRDALQEQIADRLAAAGADLIWGHHPHVLQEMEWRGGVLVLYSLGNAVFDQSVPAAARLGTLVWARIDRIGVRSYAAFSFSIDPRGGTVAAPDLLSLRFSLAPA